MQTTIKNIHKGFSNTIRIPYTIAYFACGHGIEMEYRDRSGDRHSPDNWLLQVGASADCAKCDQNHEAVERIIAFSKTAKYSHTTLRDMTASQTGEWMTFCVHQIDVTSPTQCRLEMSVEATPEVEQVLRKAGIRFERGPSRGNMARA